MLKGYENYEKLKENVLRTKRAVYEMHLCDGNLLPSHTGRENFSKLQAENTDNFLYAKIEIFISKCSTKIDRV